MPTIFASAEASGVAIAVIVSEPACTVLPVPTKARVVPVTLASGWRSDTVSPPPAPPPAAAVASSSDVADTETVPDADVRAADARPRSLP